MTAESSGWPASTREPGAFGAALAGPELPHDLEYARGKAAVAAALFGAPVELPKCGRYVVLRHLGTGGMGEVYAAHDPVLDREVALKLSRARAHADGRSEGRLLREAQLLARVSHPNIVQIHEVGVADGAVFVAMEYVAGIDLQRWLADRPRPWREVVAVLQQAGQGLVAAHREGLIHRDFKPGNVLVGDDERVRVADFGLATPLGAPGRHGPHGTTSAAATALAGTPLYMAPELLRGGPPTVMTDQYAFCVTLYEALHGARPFAGDTPTQLVAAMETRPLPATPPNPEVPMWLHAAVCRGLAAVPERRYASLAELVDLLARDPEAERLQRRRLARRTAGVIAVTALIVTLAVLAYGALRRLAIERQAEGRLAVLRGQVAELRGRGADDEASRVLQSFVALPENRGLPVVARAYLEWAAAQTDASAAVDAYASAYITARAEADSHAALRGLVEQLNAQGKVAEAAAALKVLERAAPTEAVAPELQQIRHAAALSRRDIQAARALLTDGDAGRWSSVLEDLSRTTSIDTRRLGGPFDLLGSELGVFDLDGDGDGELLTWAGRSTLRVFTADLALSPIRSVALGEPRSAGAIAPAVAGEPLLLAAYPLEPPQYELRLMTFTPDGATRTLLAWPDSHAFHAATVDLDGDGRREVYVGTEAYTRRFWRLDRADDGTWSRRSAHPRTEGAGSDMSGVVTADLDDDGRPELVTTVGPWRAYDVRAFEPGPSGALELVARRSFGSFKGLASLRAPGGDLVAFLKTEFQVAPGRFPPDKPMGEPDGLYVVGLRDGALTTVGHLPEERWAPVEDLGPLFAGDLDADGQDELVVTMGEQMALLRWRAGEPLRPLVLAGLRPALVHDFDGDGRAEILAERTDVADRMFVLGAGDSPLPPLPKAELEPRALPSAVEDPAIASAWARAEQMVAIGLPRRAAAELANIARLAGPVAPDMLLRIAEIEAGIGDDAAAAGHFVASATRPDLAGRALAGAAAAHKRLGEFAAAEALLRRLQDVAAPAERGAFAAELAALEAATAARPERTFTFTGPLDPHWRIADPVAVHRALSRGELSVWTSPSPWLAELPLVWDGGPVALEVELELDRIEWGNELSIELVRPDGQSWLKTSIRGRGVAASPEAFVMVSDGKDRDRLGIVADGPMIRARIAAYPQFGTLLREIDAGGASDRRVLPAEVPSLAPPPGSLSLRLQSRSVEPGFVSHLWIRSIRLTGFTLGEANDTADDPAWLLAEGRPAVALAKLGAAPTGSVAQLWRIDGLLRLGRLEEAKAEISALLVTAPLDGLPYQRLHQRLIRGDEVARLVARATFGPRLIDLMTGRGGELRTLNFEAVLSDLTSADPTELPSDPLAQRRLVLTDYARGQALVRAGRLVEASEALATGFARVTAGVPFDEHDVVGMNLLRELVALAVARQDRDDAVLWVQQALRHGPAPELVQERVQSDVALLSLLGAGNWDALQTELRAPR